MRDLVASTLHRRYHLKRELGKGGMGAVYPAQDLQLQRQVAITVPPPKLAVRARALPRHLHGSVHDAERGEGRPHGDRHIRDERAEARTQERANPAARSREQSRVRIMPAVFALGASGLFFANRVMRARTGPHAYRIGMGGFAVFAASPTAAAGAPLALLIAALPTPARRQLGDARGRIAELERTLTTLADRQRQLESALTEAGAATPNTDVTLRARSKTCACSCCA